MSQYLEDIKNEVNNRTRLLMRDYKIKAEFLILDREAWHELQQLATRYEYISLYEQEEPACNIFMGLKVATVETSKDFRILEVK